MRIDVLHTNLLVVVTLIIGAPKLVILLAGFHFGLQKPVCHFCHLFLITTHHKIVDQNFLDKHGRNQNYSLTNFRQVLLNHDKKRPEYEQKVED